MSHIFLRALGLAAIFSGLTTGVAFALPDAVENEVKRFAGHWRVVEMVEDGKAVPEGQMREWLPGGGILEIVDYTILFKSPLDGTKSTKTYRLDPTSYPKKIVVMDGDATTGTGIYKFDGGRLVLCISNEAASIPKDFSAPKGSKRNMIVMKQIEEGQANLPGINKPLAARRPLQIPAQPAPKPAQVEPVQIAAVQVQPAIVQVQVAPVPVIVAGGVAGVLLSDAEVRNMALGTWRIEDGEGSVDITFLANGIFQTHRYQQMIVNFHAIFVPKFFSSGNWSVTNGKLIATVSSSIRADKVNQTFMPAVRSISATDMILVDYLGRVSRAVKLR
jgi:uncharacterized protein (TIGR03067 family)